jgi:hypothetical protein
MRIRTLESRLPMMPGLGLDLCLMPSSRLIAAQFRYAPNIIEKRLGEG